MKGSPVLAALRVVLIIGGILAALAIMVILLAPDDDDEKGPSGQSGAGLPPGFAIAPPSMGI